MCMKSNNIVFVLKTTMKHMMTTLQGIVKHHKVIICFDQSLWLCLIWFIVAQHHVPYLVKWIKSVEQKHGISSVQTKKSMKIFHLQMKAVEWVLICLDCLKKNKPWILFCKKRQKFLMLNFSYIQNKWITTLYLLWKNSSFSLYIREMTTLLFFKNCSDFDKNFWQTLEFILFWTLNLFWTKIIHDTFKKSSHICSHIVFRFHAVLSSWSCFHHT
jgi:hypothetical protein